MQDGLIKDGSVKQALAEEVSVDSGAIGMTEVSIPSPAGPLDGRWIKPQGVPRHAIVIHPATGVLQRRYEKFARWLAETERAAVLTYDYRDMGRSNRKHPRQSEVKMSDWGIEDQSAALDFLRAAFPEQPVTVIGHSLGGMCVPWHRQAEAVSRVIAIASGPAYVTRHPLSYMPAVIWFWFIGGPLLTKLFGYLPGKLSGIGADLPASVFWQWRRWCTSRRFNRVDWGTVMPMPDLKRVKADVTLISFSDDVMIPPKSVRLLAAYYPAANVAHRKIRPEAHGLNSIGHLGMFSERSKAVWPALMAKASEKQWHDCLA